MQKQITVGTKPTAISNKKGDYCQLFGGGGGGTFPAEPICP